MPSYTRDYRHLHISMNNNQLLFSFIIFLVDRICFYIDPSRRMHWLFQKIFGTYRNIIEKVAFPYFVFLLVCFLSFSKVLSLIYGTIGVLEVSTEFTNHILLSLTSADSYPSQRTCLGFTNLNFVVVLEENYSVRGVFSCLSNHLISRDQCSSYFLDVSEE